jgi:hypothetical protein
VAVPVTCRCLLTEAELFRARRGSRCAGGGRKLSIDRAFCFGQSSKPSHGLTSSSQSLCLFVCYQQTLGPSTSSHPTSSHHRRSRIRRRTLSPLPSRQSFPTPRFAALVTAGSCLGDENQEPFQGRGPLSRFVLLHRCS